MILSGKHALIRNNKKMKVARKKKKNHRSKVAFRRLGTQSQPERV